VVIRVRDIPVGGTLLIGNPCCLPPPRWYPIDADWADLAVALEGALSHLLTPRRALFRMATRWFLRTRTGISWSCFPATRKLLRPELGPFRPRLALRTDGSSGRRGYIEPSSCAGRTRAAQRTFSNTDPQRRGVPRRDGVVPARRAQARPVEHGVVTKHRNPTRLSPQIRVRPPTAICPLGRAETLFCALRSGRTLQRERLKAGGSFGARNVGDLLRQRPSRAACFRGGPHALRPPGNPGPAE
jgi:hypothetical protein